MYFYRNNATKVPKDKEKLKLVSAPLIFLLKALRVAITSPQDFLKHD